VPKYVLIVDDHEAVRRAIRSRLQAESDLVMCIEAVDGVDAIEKAQELSPDVVILDFAMPEMNGLEAANTLKYMMPTVPLFLLTAHNTRELEIAARGAGICAVFSKYDNLTPLFRQIRSELNLQESRGGEMEPRSQGAH
jgi:two-component system, NarL family, response regulator NreC